MVQIAVEAQFRVDEEVEVDGRVRGLQHGPCTPEQVRGQSEPANHVLTT